MKRASFLSVAFLAAVMLTSCESTRLYDAALSSERSPYEAQAVTHRHPLIGKKYVEWGEWRLDRTKSLNRASGVVVSGFGMSNKSAGGRYAFSRGGEYLFPVTVAYYGKVGSIGGVSTEAGEASLSAGVPEVTIPLSTGDIMASCGYPVELRVEKITAFSYKDRVHHRFAGVSSGARVVVNGSDWCIADFEGSQVHLRRNYPNELSEKEREFIVSVVLALFAYHRELEQSGNMTHTGLSITSDMSAR